MSIWLKYKRYLLEQIPPWIVPYEVLKTVTSVQGRGWLKYEEILENGEQRTYLENQGRNPFQLQLV